MLMMAHLSVVDLISRLSPKTSLIGKMMELLPRCTSLHLPGGAAGSPSSQPFSKLLILLGSLRATTGTKHGLDPGRRAASKAPVHLLTGIE